MAKEVKPPADKPENKNGVKTKAAVEWLAGQGLAEKKVRRIRRGDDQPPEIAVGYRPTPFGFGLLAFCGWKPGQELTEAEFKKGLKAFREKPLGAGLRNRLGRQRKGG